MSYEVEIKIEINCDEIEEVRGKIITSGGKLIRSQKETDYYMLHPCRDFLSTDEALRVRYIDGKVESITYKGPREGKEAKSRYEIIVSIKEGDIVGLFKKLGFETGIIVEKYREYYKYKSILITLDSVKHLGCFVELELLNETDEGKLFKVAEELGITGKIIVESYAELLWKSLRK